MEFGINNADLKSGKGLQFNEKTKQTKNYWQ